MVIPKLFRASQLLYQLGHETLLAAIICKCWDTSKFSVLMCMSV